VGVTFGYIGRPIEEKTGLSDDRARWYDANTGRFINEDPTGFKGGDTNLFRYVGNDPLDRIDPSGLTAKWAGYGGKGSVPAAGWGAYGAGGQDFSKLYGSLGQVFNRLPSQQSQAANSFTGKSDRGVPFGEFLATRSSSGAITSQSSLSDARSLSGYDRLSFGIHGTLSVAGAVPFLGIVPDAIDWAYTAAELPFGKSTKTDLAFATAGIAATAAPFIGDGAAAALKMSARVARIGGNTASDVVRVAGRFDDVAVAGNTLVRQAPSSGSVLRRSVAVSTGASDAALQKAKILDGLTDVTTQSNKIADGIRNGDVRINVLGDEMFAKAYTLKGGVGDAPQAFQLGNQTYLRRGSTNLLSEIVHEGTHVLDEVGGLVKTPYHINPYAWEKRAFFYERQFQRASGGPVEFSTIDSMLKFIKGNY